VASSPSPRLPPAERRASILEAALRLFARRGYAASTTRDLAAAAGVTEPVLYRHFPSKAALFAALLREVGDRVVARLERIVAGEAGAEGRLRALAEGLPRLVSELDAEVRVLTGAAATHPDPAARDAVRSAYARVAAFLARSLREAGLRPGVDPTAAGHLLLEVGVGASILDPLDLPSARGRGGGPARLALLVRALAPAGSGRRRRG
jgi:TetR/AcrR family transcriptional regulator